MNASEHASRLASVRAEMERRDLAVLVVPQHDEHQHSYLPPNAERLAWISGFTGSAGLALIGRERAALFVDGRYTIQAAEQADPALWEHRHISKEPPEAWLETCLRPGQKLGYDPRLHTSDGLSAVLSATARAGGIAQGLETNPIDELWTDRPPPPKGAVESYPEAFAGESSPSKRRRIGAELARERLDALVISATDNLAWLLNIRGNDVPMTPLALGFAILRADGEAALFLDSSKLRADARAELDAQGISVAEPDAFGPALAALSKSRVRVDHATGSLWIVEQLTGAGAKVDVGVDPCTLAKACKTPRQVAGARAAHVRDGVALVRFLKWLHSVEPEGETEYTAGRVIDGLRGEGEHFRGPSFRTIAAMGPNSAQPHYTLRETTARALRADDILLVDSGGQYLDGTTDVTRTMVLGTPSAEMKRRYTQVLRGHIALSLARFPEGTTGSQLDALARQYLWWEGVDFDHGTGHGVGSFLSVHEGPHSVSKRPSKIALQPGMVLSNEPGYYKAGAFGIRIENLMAVTVLDPQPPDAELKTLGFETLTLAPYDRRLIELGSLGAEERAWVDAYHARVRETLTPHLGAEDAAFLAAGTTPL
jgi:Xaa-Pro aminopeptidase